MSLEEIKPGVTHDERKVTEEDDYRSFLLNFGDEEKREILVKKVPGHEEVFSKLEEQQISLKGARKLIEIFNSAKVETETASGKTINKRPKLLICGGFVRDMLMGKMPHDIDFSTNLDYEKVKNLLLEKLTDEIKEEKVNIVETGKSFGVVRIKFRETGEEYEIASFRVDGEYSEGKPVAVSMAKSPGVDADRRDFTINSMFYDPIKALVVDYTGGLHDIEKKALRFVGKPEKRIYEDNIRMLRFIRFLLKTGFSADKKSKEVIQKNTGLITNLPPDRIREELQKILSTETNGDGLRLLKEYGLLWLIMPEVDSLSGCEQGAPYHMEGDAFVHTAFVLDNLGKVSVELAMAAILHDIGKVKTRVVTEVNGKTKTSFHGHEEESVQMARVILERLKFSNKQIEKILFLISKHMVAHTFPEMRQSNAVKLAESEYIDDLVKLVEADVLASVPDSEELVDKNVERIKLVKERLAKIREFIKENKSGLDSVFKEINGKLIIKLYQEKHGVNPEGIMVGRIKNTALDLIRDNGVKTTEEAIEVLRRVIEEWK